MIVKADDAQPRASEVIDGSVWFYALLGTVFSAAGIVSLTQKLFNVGLSPVLQQLLDQYRELVRPNGA